MRYNQENKRKGLPKVIPLAILLLVLLVPAVVEAAQYYVWGRVYSAYPLAKDAEEPANPLNPLPAGHNIIGEKLIKPAPAGSDLDVEDLVAQVPRNLVKVRVLSATSGSELGSSVVTYDGGYFVSFTNPAATIDVKFVVEELATSQKLMESQYAATLSAWPANNIYYLLVKESLMEIGSDRKFACCPGAPKKYTGIFTRVGKIELATEVGGTTTRLISESTGRVTIPDSGPHPTIAEQLHIEAYQDAPFGGNLYLFGAFSQKLYDPIPSIHPITSVYYYRIRIDKFDKITNKFKFFKYMNDPLVKTKYTVNLTTLTVKTDRVTLGPITPIGGGDPYYKLTPMSSGTGAEQIFWSFPDLLALWSTGSLNGKYKLTLEIVNLAETSFCSIPGYTDLTICLDNVSPVAKILPLNSTAAGTVLDDDTPLIYNPGPAVPDPYKLLGSMLGAAANYSPGTYPICAILEFDDPSKHLAFKLGVYHENGYMRHWYFAFMRNDLKVYTKIIGKKFNGTTMEDYPGLKISTITEAYVSGVKGFLDSTATSREDKYLYLNPGHVDLSIPDGCGYRFYIEAATRSTDGYNYLYWSADEDIHYLKRQ